MLSNNVTLIGNLGSDLEIRQLESGQTLGKVNLAVTRTYTSKAGDLVKDTSWFRLVIWNQAADRMAAQVKKGARVLIEGRLQSRSYEDKNKQKREVVEIGVVNFQIVGRKDAAPATSAVQPAVAEEAPIAF